MRKSKSDSDIRNIAGRLLHELESSNCNPYDAVAVVDLLHDSVQKAFNKYVKEMIQ